MIQQIQDHAGAAGAGVTATGTVVSFVLSAMPVLQFLVLVTSLVVGVLTALWYIKKLRKDE